MADKYYTPGEEPGGGDQNRFLLMTVLLLVFLGLTFFLKPPTPPAAPAKPQTGGQAAAPSAGGSPVTTTAAPTVAAAPVGKVRKGDKTPAPAVPVKQAASEQEIVVENGLYKITFTNRGAQVKSWILKNQTDDKDQPLDLVQQAVAQKFGYPLSLYSYDDAVRQKLNDGLYVTAQSGTLKAPATVAFEYSDGDLVVKKSFAFDHSYMVHIETSVTRNGQQVQAYPAWPAGIGDQSGPTAFASAQSVYLDGQEVVRQTAHEKRFLRSDRWVVGGGTINGPLRWAGIADQYFAAIFLPDQPQDAAMVTLNHPFDIPKDREKPNPNETVSVPVIGAAVGSINGATSARLFVGPKNKEVLASVRAMENGQPTGESLESTRDLGTFGFIAKPMFVWLQWTQEHVTKNWGWAIVVLTLIINFALTPLRIMAMKQSLKMQRIQPQREAIQKKFEKYDFRDPRRAQMNQEIMDLHKREGVKMTGGCLPLLPQLPILYAFYAMLANAIELRHAHWAWIHDLSSPDPWHLLPILTIATMLLMQKMMPQIGMDPTQRMMMNVMSPLMFGMFTWAAASGLALYWTVGSVIGLGQQWIINQTKLGRELREMQLKRAKKK